MNFGEKILERAVDIALVGIYFNLELFGTKRKDWIKLQSNIDEDLEKFDYEKIKRAISNLKRKGLVQAGREKFTLPQITQEGRKRLSLIIPKYDKKRVWDKRVYLITYDLPVNKNVERNSLRSFLKKIGCGMLQKSVWLTPYNPTELLDEFAKQKGIEEIVLVSSIGKNGTIGKHNMIDLLAEVYKLDRLNRKYEEFIFNVKKKEARKEALVFQYLNILGNDPQLPFLLLPEWWTGDEAYDYFYKLTH